MSHLDLDEIVALDDRFFLWLGGIPRSPLLDLFVAWLIDARIVKFIPFLLVMCWLWFERSSRQQLARHVVIEAVFTGLAAIFVARALALTLPFRERPVASFDLHLQVPFEAGLRTWSSFPSDHAVMAFALAASLFRISWPIGLWAFFHAAVFVCFPRLYFGLHYPSDLVAGVLIGVALAWVVSLLPGRERVTSPLIGVERKHPEIFYPVGFFILFEIAEMFDSVRIVAVNVFRVLRRLLF
jgi:membrane-associated phospholipid phosphatase